jgi:hypothetical protein
LVERVKITPSQIVLKDSGGNIKFNTDYAYIKTGGGTLFAGGYQRAPAIYGQNSVTDHPSEGWYMSSIFTGNTFHPNEDWRYYWNVPKANSVEFRILADASVDGWGPPAFTSANTSRKLQYYNNDTGVRSDTTITYQWAMTRRGYNLDSEGNPSTYQWQAYPIFTTNVFPEVTNPRGGTYEIVYAANEHLNWRRIFTGTDEYGVPYSNTQYGSQYYGARTYTDEYGNSYTTPAETIYWRRNGIFTKRSPVALSLAVTP